jgi:hypothetical protein
VTLRLGSREGLYVLSGSCVVVAVLSTLQLGNYQLGLMYGFLQGVVFWLPVWLIAWVLRESRQMVLAIEVAVLLGILAVIGFYLFQSAPAQFWGDVFKVMISMIQQNQPDIPLDMLQQSANALAPYMTGIMLAGVVFSLLLGLFVARLWQARLYNPGGFKAEYLALSGHAPLAIATLVLFAIASFLNSELCWNILVVLVVFYASIGTAVLHSLISVLRGSRYWLLLFYVVLFFSLKLMALVAIFGLMDTWLNLRNKLKPNGA